MIEGRAIEQTITAALPLLLSVAMLGMAYTREQRQHIIDRDGGVCQFPERHKCGGGPDTPEQDRVLQVHHIIPQRYAKEIGIEDPDFEENGITVCKEAHVGPHGIHPDISRAHRAEEFKDVFKEREEKLNHRQIYWNDKWDRILHALSIRNTQRFKKSGRVFPPHVEKPPHPYSKP